MILLVYSQKRQTGRRGKVLYSDSETRHQAELQDPPAEAVVLVSELCSAPEPPCLTLSGGTPLHLTGLWWGSLSV